MEVRWKNIHQDLEMEFWEPDAVEIIGSLELLEPRLDVGGVVQW